jgi:cation transport protein ChaC
MRPATITAWTEYFPVSPKRDFWLFAYGSLIWDPCFPYDRREPARVFGRHRRLSLWSHVEPGTPENPGLAFALERGGSCRGMGYRIPKSRLEEAMGPLWAREMDSELCYIPALIPARLDSGKTVLAAAFLANPAHPDHAGHLSPKVMAETVARVPGNEAYIANTLSELAKLGLRDRMMEEVLRLVKPPR